jgi:hypothetical protein
MVKAAGTFGRRITPQQREGCVFAKDFGLPQGTLKLLAPGERSRIGERSPGWRRFASAASRAR